MGQRASRGKGDREGIIRGVGTERVERVSPPLVSRPRRPPRDCFPWGRHRVSGPSYNTTPSGPTSPELALAEGPVGPPLRPPYILVLPLLDAAKVSSRFSRPRNSIRSRTKHRRALALENMTIDAEDDNGNVSFFLLCLYMTRLYYCNLSEVFYNARVNSAFARRWRIYFTIGSAIYYNSSETNTYNIIPFIRVTREFLGRGQWMADTRQRWTSR